MAALAERGIACLLPKMPCNLAVLDVNAKDSEVYVGIRPEGFTVDEDGALECDFSNLEVMGRDVSVVASHKASEAPIVRAILPSDSKLPARTSTVRFSLKREKLLVFDKTTEERIYF